MILWSILGFLTLPGSSGGAGSDAFDSRQLLASLLIVVGVGLDLIGQIEAHLVSRQYEGFVQGTRMRGRLGR